MNDAEAAVIFENVKGATVECFARDAVGVSIGIQVKRWLNSTPQWIDILCTGRLIFIRSPRESVLLVDAPDYIDEGACAQFPIGAVIEDFDFSANVHGFVLTFADQSKLFAQAVVVEGYDYAILLGRWKGPISAENLMCQATLSVRS